MIVGPILWSGDGRFYGVAERAMPLVIGKIYVYSWCRKGKVLSFPLNMVVDWGTGSVVERCKWNGWIRIS